MRGKISKFDKKRGYGFITVAAGKDDVFFHINDVQSDSDQLAIAASVRFEMGRSAKGPCARSVVVTRRPPASANKFFVTAAILLILLAVLLVKFHSDASLLLTWLIAVNIASFFLCGHDKGAATVSATRVPQAVLLGTAFLGGAAGLLLAMNCFRHKIRSTVFLMLVVLMLIVQLWALWLVLRV